MPRLVQICFISALSLSACGEIEAPIDAKNDGLTYAKLSNTELNLAMGEARKTLPYFWSTLEAAQIEFDAAQAALDAQVEENAQRKKKNKTKDQDENEEEIITYAGPNDFSLKVGLRTIDDSLEHIWVDNIIRKDGMIYGLLANDPDKLANLRIGQEVQFRPFQISDWSYSYEGKLYGHYSTRALLGKMSVEEAAAMRKILGDNVQAGSQ